MSSNDIVIPSLIAGDYSDSNSINVVVSSNTLSGYTVSANTNDEDLTSNIGNNSNSNSSNSNYTFSSLATDASLEDLSTADDNTWGYSYSLDSGVSWSNYSGLSMSSNSILYDTISPADNKTISFKIGAKASSDQPSGVYTTTINFMAVSKVTPTSLLDAYRNEHKTMVNGYYTMQDMTNTICANTDIYDEQLQVIDIRDNKVYWISKLRDDNCWMTENLDLDLETTPTNVLPLTSDNTDLNLYGSMGYTASNGYSCSNPDDPEATLTADCSGEGEVITWTPVRSTLATDNISGWRNSASSPYSYDRGLMYPDNKVSASIAETHGLSGNYYNWTASIASNASNSYDASTDAAKVAANSICPAGWRLPNTASMEGGYEFSKLLYEYGITTDNQNTAGYANGGFNRIIASPLYFVRAGFLRGSISYSGGYGFYWSSVPVPNSSNSGTFYFDSDGVIPFRARGSYDGHTLRCLAK